MDIKIELEIKAKAFEIFKKILNKNNTIITFNDMGIPDIIESNTIKNRLHVFKIFKRNINIKVDVVNNFYKLLIPNKLLKLPNKGQQKAEIKKLRYIKIIRLFFKKIYKEKDIAKEHYYINYNGVVYLVKKEEYNKLNYYAEYAYKIYQLKKLNKELGIEQNITINFDEDILSANMYDKMYDIIKDVF